MSTKSDRSVPPSNAIPTPWHDLDEAGSGLTVDVFITTLMSQVGNALRRTITLPYADQFGLSVSEWRLLALLAPVQRIAFSDLVAQSTSDKALVSRTLKAMEGRGLVALEAQGNTPRKKVYCAVTPAGRKLHEQAVPIARQRQAAAIRSMAPQERDVMFRALMTLRAYCSQHEAAQDRPARGRGDVSGMDI